MNKLGMPMTESLVTYCWGLSKFVQKDDEGKQKKYLTITLVEFMEFLARAFYLKLKQIQDNISEVNQND